MATDIDKTTSLKALADSTALIYDRAITPERVVGQAWLISKGRVATTASAVANYSEAPWALVVKFPHPDVTYGVRTIQVHPDFNKREARDHYLSQAYGTPTPVSFDNDIATLALESDLTPPPPEKIAELNRALSVPFEISPRDMSGSMRPGDLPSILQSAITTGRSGLLTMVDVRNIPFARIGLRQARITKVEYNGLYNEVGLCELLYRKPTGNFAFQPTEEYKWPSDLHELSTTAEQIVAEGVRRADELPKVIEMLGGLETRFDKATKYADFSTIKQHERWVAERLWEVFDGYLPLSKVAERISADTYSTVKMIWEFANMGLITPSQAKAFHSNGQVGPMLVPAQDLELSVWDDLTGFFLDPISGNPVQVKGNLYGPSKVLNNKTLLHTVSLPPAVLTAAILKDSKLVGLYSGPYVVKGGANAPPMGLNKMTWIGALNDLGAKRLRTDTTENSEPVEVPMEKDPSVSQKISLRSRAASMSIPEMPATPMPAEEESGPLAKFSKQQLAMAAAGSLGLCFLMMLFGMLSPHPAPAPTVVAANTSTATSTAANTTTTSTTPATSVAPVSSPNGEKVELGDEKAAAVAKDSFGLQIPPNQFVFEDTSEKTKPKISFGIASELKNLDIMFYLWPNQAPISDLNLIAKAPPFTGMYRQEVSVIEFKGSTAHTSWMGGHYLMGEKQELGTAVVGVWPGKNQNNECVIFVAKPHTGLALSDLYAVPNMVEEFIRMNSGTPKPAGANTAASGQQTGGELAKPEELLAYRKKLGALIQSNYKQPKEAESGGDNKVGMSFSVDTEGKVSDLQIKPNANEDFNNAIRKAYDQSQPLPAAPKTKSGKYTVMVTADGSTVTVDEI
jgi:hypothetical protein